MLGGVLPPWHLIADYGASSLGLAAVPSRKRGEFMLTKSENAAFRWKCRSTYRDNRLTIAWSSAPETRSQTRAKEGDMRQSLGCYLMYQPCVSTLHRAVGKADGEVELYGYCTVHVLPVCVWSSAVSLLAILNVLCVFFPFFFYFMNEIAIFCLQCGLTVDYCVAKPQDGVGSPRN